MKKIKLIVAIGTLTCAFAGPSVSAQRATDAPPLDQTPPVVTRPVDPTPPTDHPVVPVRPVIISRPEVSGLQAATTRPDRPSAPGPAIAQEVKQMVQQFQDAREAYIAKQQELAAKLRAASADEREGIRAQMTELREKWLSGQKAVREEFLARAKEIRNEFKNRERDKVIDSAKEEGRHK